MSDTFTHFKQVIEAELKPEWIKTRDGGGNTKLRYIEGSRVIRILNDAFAYKWSFDVLDWQIVTTPQQPLTARNARGFSEWVCHANCSNCQNQFKYLRSKRNDYVQNPKCPSCGTTYNAKEDQFPEHAISQTPQQFVVVRGALIAQLDGETYTKTHIGSKTMVGGLEEMESSIKAAATDCLKKCASLFGVGLELWDSADTDNDDVEDYSPPSRQQASRPAPVQNNTASNSDTEVVNHNEWNEVTLKQYESQRVFIRETKEKLADAFGSETEAVKRIEIMLTDWSRSSVTGVNQLLPVHIIPFVTYLKENLEQVLKTAD